MKPDWLKLIEEWQARHHLGLTIPFLIGALRQSSRRPFLPDATGLEQLRALIASLRDDILDGLIMRLYTCNRLRDLVVLVEPNHITICSERLLVERGIVPDGAPPEALVTELWKRYGEVIEAGRFSLRAGIFQPFKEDDLALISAAFARPEEDDP